MFKHKRVLTIVEGRELNLDMVRNVAKTAEKMGWGTRIVKKVGPIDVAENNLDKIFSDYVWWRGLGSGSLQEIERMLIFLNNSDRVTLNTHAVGGIACISNKYFQHGILMNDEYLSKHVLKMYPINNVAQLESLLAIGKMQYPFCLKPMVGTRGLNIHLVRDRDEFSDVVGSLNLRDYTVEEYVKSKFNWRVFIVGGRAVGIMRKTGDELDEANFEAKSGGRNRENETDPDVRSVLIDLAERAARAARLDYTGIDLVRDDDTGEYYLLELNFAAGWQNGFKEATGVDMGEELIGYFEEQYQKREGEA